LEEVPAIALPHLHLLASPPGAVLTRVAASHLRVGTFQYAAAQGDPALVADCRPC
jgi:uncharacterized protein YdiU (UPF0061 family)